MRADVPRSSDAAGEHRDAAALCSGGVGEMSGIFRDAFLERERGVRCTPVLEESKERRGWEAVRHVYEALEERWRSMRCSTFMRRWRIVRGASGAPCLCVV